MTLKQTFKLALLRIAKLTGLFRLSRYLTRKGLMVICWHGVSLDDEHQRFPDLFISSDSLRKRLEFIKKNYTVIDLDEALRQHRAGEFKPYQIVLTFDDGYYNFVSRAAPLLEEFQMTATVYLTTFFMDNQQPVPNMLLRDIALLAENQNVGLNCLNLSEPFQVRTRADRARLTRMLMDVYLALPAEAAERLSFVIDVGRGLKVDVDKLIRDRVWHRLNAAEVAELDKRGFSIEPHGHQHLNVVDHHDVIEPEAQICRDRIRDVTGKAAVHFCYPSARWNRQAWDGLQKAGIETSTTLEEGPNYPQTPLLAMRRVSNGESRNQLEFEFETSNLKYLLRCLMGRTEKYVPAEKLAAGKTLEQKALG